MHLPLLLALAVQPAHAASGGPTVALTLAPAQLAIPRAELTADVRIAGKTSVAGILGVDISSPLGVHHFGGQLRNTFSGSWDRGAFLGLEVVTGDGGWLHKDSAGVAFGGFVGGRYTFHPALTLEGAIGGNLHWLDQKLYPGVIVNLGLGWSF